VYKDNQELQLATPAGGQMTVGEEGKVSQINLVITTPTSETVSTPSSPSGPRPVQQPLPILSRQAVPVQAWAIPLSIDSIGQTGPIPIGPSSTSREKSWAFCGSILLEGTGKVCRPSLCCFSVVRTLCCQHIRSLSEAKPDLLQATGWSDAIVVSKEAGTSTDSGVLYTTDTLYVDWAVVNKGSVDIATRSMYPSLWMGHLRSHGILSH